MTQRCFRLGDLSLLTTLVLPFCSQQAECEESSQLDQDGKVCASQFLTVRVVKAKSGSVSRQRRIIFCS